MKQALRRELTNIVFLILIVASAVVIYLLSRAEDGDRATPVSPETTSIQGAQTESLQTGLDETPAPTSAAEATASVRGVPEAVARSPIFMAFSLTLVNRRGRLTLESLQGFQC